MIECYRKIHFCAGHRVMNHESKCSNLHGHNYVLWVYAAPKNGLDKIGRVIDFSVLKEKIGGWIEKNWDHQFLLFEKDKFILKEVSSDLLTLVPFNPTAENMAEYLINVICPKLFIDTEIDIIKVELFETENCGAVVLKNENI